MVLLKHAALIDGTGAGPYMNADVRIKDGRICEVGTGLSLQEGEEMVDLAGKWLIPGLMDAHVHMSMDPGDGALAEKEFLDYGVTTIRSAGEFGCDIIERREAAKEHFYEAPDILASGLIVQADGGNPYCTAAGSHPALRDKVILVNDETDIEGEIAKGALRKPDFVKAFVTDDDFRGRENRVPAITEAQMKRICDAAHKAGIPVMTHVDDIHDSLVAVRGGTDTLEHLINPESYDHEVTDELIDEMLKRGVPLIPTIIATYHLEIDLNSPFSVVDAVLKDVKILKDAGVPIGVGCDSGNNAVYFGKSVHEEMAWLVKAGLTPLEAITAATGVDAKALGIADDRGTIEPGKRADLVVLRKDPLEDIANTLSIEAVYKAGRIVR